MEKIVDVCNLTKKYGNRVVVDNLNFSLDQGQILGLLGPNGAGKTTTMRMLMGLTRPSSGKATILGFNVTTETKKYQAHIGVSFERPNLFENLSGYQNLAIFCKLYQKPVSSINPLLERMGLADRANEPVKVYSKGMRQRILILRALIHQPKLLFLDEPASGLDPVSSRTIWDYLQEQKNKGMTIIITSHDMEEVDTLCDQIGFINHGRLITLSEPHILKQRYGQSSLKVTYQNQTGDIIEETLYPEKTGFDYLQQLYQGHKVLSVHSQEASLGEIFRQLSNE